MTIVERVHHEHDLPERARDYARDTLTLGWEARLQGHGRRVTDGGIEFGLSLPRGSVLRAADCLVLDGDRTIVQVVERDEPVFVIEPGTPSDWALYGYHIGTRHQPLMVTDRGLVCPDAPGVQQLLDHLRIPYARAVLPFTPAAATQGHQH
jgi:urease accessory protein UreE